MKMTIGMFLAFIMIFTFSSCSSKATEENVEAVESYFQRISAFESSSPLEDSVDLVDLSTEILGLPADTIDFSDGWEESNMESTDEPNDIGYEKEIRLFNSDAHIRIILLSDTIKSIEFGFYVDSAETVYLSADSIIDAYGEPLSVNLNSESSSHAEIANITNMDDDEFYYIWLPEYENLSISLHHFFLGVHYATLYINLNEV